MSCPATARKRLEPSKATDWTLDKVLRDLGLAAMDPLRIKFSTHGKCLNLSRKPAWIRAHPHGTSTSIKAIFGKIREGPRIPYTSTYYSTRSRQPIYVTSNNMNMRYLFPRPTPKKAQGLFWMAQRYHFSRVSKFHDRRPDCKLVGG